jgi:hypothetical protein
MYIACGFKETKRTSASGDMNFGTIEYMLELEESNT